MNPIKVGIVGCGNIGSDLAQFVHAHEKCTLDSVCDVDAVAVQAIMDETKPNPPEYLDLTDLMKRVDLTVEAANKNVAGAVLNSPHLDAPGKKLVVMSTSALIDQSDRVRQLKQCQVFLPSGAIAGLDAIKAVADRIVSLTLTTTKPPQALSGAPYVVENNIDLEGFSAPTRIFAGGLQEVVRGFPKNVNVAATLFLASRFDGIRVEVVVHPTTTLNTHEIVCSGDFGTITARTENKPSPNPKTSFLAVLSAKRTIANIVERMHVGT